MTSLTSLFLFEKGPHSYPGMLDLKKKKKNNDLMITDYLIEHFQ